MRIEFQNDYTLTNGKSIKNINLININYNKFIVADNKSLIDAAANTIILSVFEIQTWYYSHTEAFSRLIHKCVKNIIYLSTLHSMVHTYQKRL